MEPITDRLSNAFHEGDRRSARELAWAALEDNVASAQRPWSTYQQLVAICLAAGEDDIVSIGLQAIAATTLDIGVEDHREEAVWIVYFRRDRADGFTLEISPTLRKQVHFFGNVMRELPLLCAFCERSDVQGRVALNNWDAGVVPGLAWCGNQPTHTLIPDPEFVAAHGYRDLRAQFAAAGGPWSERADIAGWRGSMTGINVDNDWSKLPRVRLAQVSKLWPQLVDAKLTSGAPGVPAEAFQAVTAQNLTAPSIAQTDFLKYRYLIDIDGYTNAWSGFFLKLCSGSTVLKVASPHGFQQWYYPRLKPWEHFVPVRADLADLPSLVLWLRDNQPRAEQIAQAAVAFAASMTYESELEHAVSAIASAMTPIG